MYRYKWYPCLFEFLWWGSCGKFRKQGLSRFYVEEENWGGLKKYKRGKKAQFDIIMKTEHKKALIVFDMNFFFHVCGSNGSSFCDIFM